MPKTKTNKALAKRIRFTKTGKMKRRHAGHRHLLSGKSAKKRNSLNRCDIISGVVARSYKRAMGM